MSDPEIGGREPIAVEVEARQDLLVVRLRAHQAPAVLRWVAQGDRLRADRMPG
jgi:hypothetical protein